MPERKRLVAGNWKMNMLRADGVRVGPRRSPSGRAQATHRCDLLVCPPFTLLAAIGAALAGSGVALGGQDCHPQASGAFTGCVSAEMLKDAGCSHAIVGHSERRQACGETDADVQAKTRAAWRAGLVAIVCVGETRRRARGRAGARHGRGAARRLVAGRRRRRAADRRLRAGLGDRHRADADDRRHRRDARRDPRLASRPARGSCTAARSTRKTPPRSWRSTRSTARWSAAPASRPTISGRSRRRCAGKLDPANRRSREARRGPAAIGVAASSQRRQKRLD